MAVVINDFEVVAEPPAAAPSGADSPSESPAAAAPTPQEIEQIMRRHRERCARVRAH
jgi:hypothetical protein